MAAPAVLGISPGTRVIGLAVMRDGELIDFRVKSFKETFTRAKMQDILDTIFAFCDYNGVKTICLKKVDPLKSSPQLDRLVRNIQRQAKRHGIKVRSYSLSDLDYDARSKRKLTRDGLAEQVAEKHPELRHAYIRERNNRTEYYTKMFEAVAMAEQLGDQ